MAGEVNLINNDLKVPYSDQFSLGMRNRLARLEHQRAVVARRQQGRLRVHDGQSLSERRLLAEPRATLGQFAARTRRRAAGGRQRHRDREHAGAAVRRQAVHRGIALGRDVFLHVSPTPSRIATSTSTTHSTRSSINEYPVHPVERRGQTSRGRHRLVCRALGLHARGQAHLVDADSAQLSISCLAATGAHSPTARPCTAFAYDAGRTMDTSRSICRSPRTSSIGDLGSMYLRIDVLNVTNEAQPGRLHRRESGRTAWSPAARYNPVGNITGCPAHGAHDRSA